MEYCSGGSLREFCRHYRQGVPEDELREIVRDICAGLRYLHRKHIVHRDIKPDNIVIQKAERFVYKITDLGYMKVLDPRSITRSFIGTAAYAAPEILESGSHVRKYNYLVDYWSLGVTVFEVATGFRPFRDIPTCGKKQDTIWGRRTLMGIEYFNELPVRCKFTPSFGRLLTKWLQTMLQHHPPHRNPDLSLTPLDAMIRFVAVTEKRVDVRLPSMANQDLDEEPMQEAARAAHERKAKKFQTYMADPSSQQKRPVEWQKIKVLGKGSFGEVSVWKEVHSQQLIAVKVRPAFPDARKDKHIEYWKKEVETMYKLKHPNIVQAVVLPDELLAKLNTQLSPLGMEYINGGSLRALMERPEYRWLPEQQVRHVLYDMCRGLQYLHNEHIVHRDIKPENIVIQLTGTERNIYKIIDLGYIKVLNPDSVTQSLVGTMAYIAPEIFQSTRKYNYLVDYWSLGIVAFEITTGIRPFAAVSWQEMQQHAPKLMEHNPGIIYAMRTPQGIEYMKDLPDRPLQKRFKEDLTMWLRTVLSFNPKQRNPDPKISSLEAMVSMLNRKVVQIFNTTSQSMVTLTESSTPEELHTGTMILPSNQLLISADGKSISFAQLMERVVPHVECNLVTAYIFSFNSSYILSAKPLPAHVAQRLASPGSDSRRKRLWQEMYHHIDGEYSNCIATLAAYRTLILYLNSLHSEFNAKLSVLSASYKEVKISAKILRDNQDYDRIQMAKYAHSALEELREIRTPDLLQNVAAIKANMTKIVARANTLHSQLAKLRENPYSCSKPPTNLESLRNEVLATLKKFNPTRQNEDMTVNVQNFKSEYTRLLKELSAQFCVALSHVREVQAAAAQCQTFAAEVAREQTKLQLMQQERRVAVWNVIKKLMLSESQNESITGMTDSLTRKPNVELIVKDNKDHRTQLDSLNSLMELELTSLNENMTSFSSFM
ncbi:inhibitor of nuclear factor kappa-B kinase subunit alpha [Galendromus occidentalis]|uniref:IkappaB kinase n=1 Tax=Galendromus occidentalis TaxID=34638 RepID=A0AAJ7WIX2_9ACAR|nr:inhibitor of nuclear factor kappa-B kinase subunit alpha [Galendromus occidentalis]